MNDLAERLVALRRGLSRREFAKNLGITESTLRNYEKGASSPDAQFLANICKKMAISPEWILFGIGPTRTTDAPRKKDEVIVETSSRECPRCAKVERELELEREERRELAVETRKLYREKEELHLAKEQLLREKEADKAELLREIGDLRAKVARLEASKNRLAGASGIHSENSGVA